MNARITPAPAQDRSRCLLDAVHRQPRSSRRTRGCWPAPRACTTGPPTAAQCSTAIAGLWCVQRRSWPARDHRGGDAAARHHGFCAHLSDGPSARVRARRIGWPRSRRPGMDRVFFTNSGSESVDTALKIAHRLPSRARPGAAHPPDRPREAAITASASAAFRSAAWSTTASIFGAPCCRVWTICRTRIDLGHNAFSRGLPRMGHASRRRRWSA